MNHRTSQLLHRFPEGMWRNAPRRRIAALFRAGGLLHRFLLVAKPGLFHVTVVVPNALDACGHAPGKRTKHLKLLVAECLGSAPCVYGDWEFTKTQEPHFHAILDSSGVEKVQQTFHNVQVEPISVERGGLHGAVRYLLKPRRAAQVRQAIEHLESLDEGTGLAILAEVWSDTLWERELLRSKEGKRRMPSRLHGHAVRPRFRPLTNQEWICIQPFFPPGRDCGRPESDQRAVLNALLWRGHYGLSFREIQSPHPHWRTCARKLKDWQDSGLLAAIAERLPPRFRQSFDTGSSMPED